MVSPPWTLRYADEARSKSISRLQGLDLRDPPGLRNHVAAATGPVQQNTRKPANLDGLRQQKAWELAIAPAKNVPMQALMMYMAGGGVQVFSAMSVFFLLKQSFQGIANTNKTFAHLETSASTSTRKTEPSSINRFVPQKALFMVCQLLLVGIALYKLHTMGALPSEDDWLMLHRVTPKPYEPRYDIVEYADGDTYIVSL